MYTKVSRITLCILLTGWWNIILCSGTLVSQETSPNSSTIEPKFVEPPLAEYSGSTPFNLEELAKRLHAQDGRPPVPGTVRPLAAVNLEPQTLITKTVDLSRTIRLYAQQHQMSLVAARLEAMSFLGIQPREFDQRLPDDGATFTSESEDIYRITADETFFKVLPAMLTSFELGKLQIEFEVMYISLDVRFSNRITRYLKPGTEEVVCSRLPQASPYATRNLEMDNESFISTSHVVQQNLPITLGQVTDDNLEKMLNALKGDMRVSLCKSPPVKLLPGELATVNDMSYRPFVIGLTGKRGFDGVTAHQPIIQPIEEGTSIRVRAVPTIGGIQVFSDIAVSQIDSVDEFTFASGGSDLSQQTVQVPKQSLHQVHLSMRMNSDHTYLIDPNFVSKVDRTDTRGKSQTTKRKLVLLMSARLVQAQPPGDD